MVQKVVKGFMSMFEGMSNIFATTDVLSNQGCGVGVGGVACFQLESESGVGVGFSKLLESESGVGTFVAIIDSNDY